MPDFFVWQLGNRVDIYADQQDFEVAWGYATGTSLPIANITAPDGFEWEVTCSGTFLANVKLLSMESVGGHLWGNYWPYKQIYNPYIAGTHQTLGDITSLTPQLLEEGTRAGWTSPRAQMNKNYVFLSNYDTGNLTRYAISDLSDVTYNPSPGELYYFEVINDTTVYTLEKVEIDSIVYYQLCKVIFTSGSSSKTVLHQWLWIDYNFGGSPYQSDEPVCLEHIKYGAIDKIICMVTYISTELIPTRSMIKGVICTVSTGDCVDVDVNGYTDDYSIINSAYYDCAPVFYNGLLIWSYYLEPDSTTGEHATISTAIVDASDDTITIVDDIKANLSASEEDYYYFGTAFIDYLTSTYYFEYVHTNGATDVFRLGKIELISLSFSSEYVKDIATDDWTYAFTALLSDKDGYMFANEYEDTQNVYNIPEVTVKTTVDINTLLYDNYCCCIIDIPEEMIWNLTNTNLQGKSLIDPDNDRDITIEWSGGVVPFENSRQRKVYLLIHDKVAVVGIYSYYLSNYQFDWYILKETEA